MEAWSAHHHYREAERTLGKDRAERLRGYSQRLQRSGLPVVFTLRHLSKIVGVDYTFLRATVERRRETANYRMFAIKKRSGGRRFIHAVSGDLFLTQQFINANILRFLKPHYAAYAFHSQGGIRECAAVHCGARWIFQYDLRNFFYDVSEADVYAVFSEAGYRPLLAFELARICTTTRLPSDNKGHPRIRIFLQVIGHFSD
jgi:RNA-directed DNA polymerase